MSDQTGVVEKLDGLIRRASTERLVMDARDLIWIGERVAELIAAVEHDFATRRRVPIAGPQELQSATDRVFAALSACKGGAS